jgi:hypothetical protein
MSITEDPNPTGPLKVDIPEILNEVPTILVPLIPPPIKLPPT